MMMNDRKISFFYLIVCKKSKPFSRNLDQKMKNLNFYFITEIKLTWMTKALIQSIMFIKKKGKNPTIFSVQPI